MLFRRERKIGLNRFFEFVTISCLTFILSNKKIHVIGTLTVHNKEKEINQKVFKLMYVQWFFVVVFLLTVAIENKDVL